MVSRARLLVAAAPTPVRGRRAQQPVPGWRRGGIARRADVPLVGRGRALPRLGHAGPEKETEPIKNLRTMQTRQTLASREPAAEEARREEALALVAATSPGKSADNLLDAYTKKEDKLNVTGSFDFFP